MVRRGVAVVLSLTWAACAGQGRSERGSFVDLPPRAASAQATGVGGAIMLRVLTYNVAGLPQWLSKSRPRDNLPRIGLLMNGYDLALVQEDFAYPSRLRQHVRFRQATPGEGRRFAFALGDGLSRFANHAYGDERRATWSACSGHLRRFSDCLADKGFSVASHELGNGLSIDVYNVHLDAGSAREDLEARRQQVVQLARYVAEHSAHRAVLIGGDTNLQRGRDREALGQLEGLTGCVDACDELHCGDAKRVDRILFRSSPDVHVEATGWELDPRFVDDVGRPLSDHDPVAVTFRLQRVNQDSVAHSQ